MPRSNSLELRSLAQIAAAYFLAPLAGLTALWLVWIVPNSPLPSVFAAWVFMIVVGGVACLAVELVIVTPLLLGYRRFRWRWLNGWSGAAIAFAIGAICALAWDVYEATRQYPGVSSWGPNGVAYVINGVQTEAGRRLWHDQLLPSVAAAGTVGAISAVVFRLLAVRARPTASNTIFKVN